MTERMTITDADIRQLLDVVDRSRAGERGTFVPFSMLRDLATVVPFDEATFQVMEAPGGCTWLQEVDCPDAVVDNDRLDVWLPAWWECCSYPQRTGDYVSIWRGSDRIPGFEPGPNWARFLATVPDFPKWRVVIPLPPWGSIDRRVALWRHGGSDFTDREVRLLALLRPHLTEMFDLQRQLRNDGPALTARQLQILALVGDGDTNAQIARQLGVSEATVRKHLENAYARLGVTNRIAAVRATRDLKYAV